MINAIIFSKDRAIQLRLLLDSIKKNADGIFNINIIYTGDNNEFEQGYEKLISEEIVEGINWVKQSEDFKQDVLNLFDDEYKFTCCFTDDDIIFKTINEEEIINTIKSDPEIFCFSLRLGKNVTWCYTQKCDNKN